MSYCAPSQRSWVRFHRYEFIPIDAMVDKECNRCHSAPADFSSVKQMIRSMRHAVASGRRMWNLMDGSSTRSALDAGRNHIRPDCEPFFPALFLSPGGRSYPGDYSSLTDRRYCVRNPLTEVRRRKADGMPDGMPGRSATGHRRLPFLTPWH